MGWDVVRGCVHAEVERGSDGGVGAWGVMEIAHGGWGSGWHCCIRVVYVCNLSVQNAVDELFVFPILFQLMDFPGVREALSIGGQAYCLSFE